MIPTIPEPLKKTLQSFEEGWDLSEFVDVGPASITSQHYSLERYREFVEFCMDIGVITSEERKTLLFRAAVAVICGDIPNLKKIAIGIKNERKYV